MVVSTFSSSVRISLQMLSSPLTLMQSGRSTCGRINRYLVELAGEFHRFYSACRIKGETPALLAARLKLADSVRSVLANCLGLLGVTAPEKM